MTSFLAGQKCISLSRFAFRLMLEKSCHEGLGADQMAQGNFIGR
jgi:hypothetical protein